VNNKGKTYLVVLAVWFLGVSSQVSHAQLFTVTPHDLLPEQKIVVDGEEVPQWKALWVQARKSALQGDFETALRQYKTLLVLKSNLEEARWELSRLMVYMKRWSEAAEHLELLIESAPESTLYINSLGKVMWEMGQYERAVDLFRKVHDKNPTDQTALAGLVEGLNSQIKGCGVILPFFYMKLKIMKRPGRISPFCPGMKM
jgi:tetratricopeptide (TPR) repeat protein